MRRIAASSAPNRATGKVVINDMSYSSATLGSGHKMFFVLSDSVIQVLQKESLNGRTLFLAQLFEAQIRRGDRTKVHAVADGNIWAAQDATIALSEGVWENIALAFGRPTHVLIDHRRSTVASGSLRSSWPLAGPTTKTALTASVPPFSFYPAADCTAADSLVMPETDPAQVTATPFRGAAPIPIGRCRVIERIGSRSTTRYDKPMLQISPLQFVTGYESRP